jgi:type III restriction enzyme
VAQSVAGIQYEKTNEWDEEQEARSDRLVLVSNSICDYVTCDSEWSAAFVEKLGRKEDVCLFVKLPAWFKVRTPVG